MSVQAFLKIYFKEFYFWLPWVFVAGSLVGTSGGYSLVVVLGLLIAVASLFVA